MSKLYKLSMEVTVFVEADSLVDAVRMGDDVGVIQYRSTLQINGFDATEEDVLSVNRDKHEYVFSRKATDNPYAPRQYECESQAEYLQRVAREEAAA